MTSMCSLESTITAPATAPCLATQLDAERCQNATDGWNRLDKTTKLRKLTAFAEAYARREGLADAERAHLVAFFRECLDKKRLHRIKDVQYDKESGLVTEVPALLCVAQRFTLRNLDKRVSTLKGLAPPKKKQGTVRHLEPVA